MRASMFAAWASVSAFPPAATRAALRAALHLGFMLTFLKTVVVLAAIFSIVPLMVLGATGSWRHAWFALRQYLSVLAVFALIGGGAAVLVAFTG